MAIPEVRSAVYYPAESWILLDVYFPVALSSINACNLMYFYPEMDPTPDPYVGPQNVTAVSLSKYSDKLIQLSPNIIQVKLVTSLLKRAPIRGDNFRYVSFEYTNPTTGISSNSLTANDVPVYIYGNETVSVSISSKSNNIAILAVSSTAPITAAPTVYNAADNTIYTSSAWNGSIVTVSNLAAASMYSFYLNIPTVVGDISSNVLSVETYPDNVYTAGSATLPGSILLSVGTTGVKNITAISGSVSTTGEDSGSKTYSVVRQNPADATSDISSIEISNLLFGATYSLLITATNTGGVVNSTMVNATSVQFPTIEFITANDTYITIKPSYPSISNIQIISDTNLSYAVSADAYYNGTSDILDIVGRTIGTTYTFKLVGTIGTKSGETAFITASTSSVGISIPTVNTTSAVVHIDCAVPVTGVPTVYSQDGSIMPNQVYDTGTQNITISNLASATQYTIYVAVPTADATIQSGTRSFTTLVEYSTSSTQPAAVIISLLSTGIKDITSVDGYYNSNIDAGPKTFIVKRAANDDISTITITDLTFSTNYSFQITMYNAQNVYFTANITAQSGDFPTIVATAITDTTVTLVPSYAGVTDLQVWNGDNVEYSNAIPGVLVDITGYVAGTSTGILISGLSPLTTYSFRLFGYVGINGNASPIITATTGDVGSGAGGSGGGSGGAGSGGSGGSGGAGAGAGSGGSGAGGSGAVPCIPAGQRILTQRGLVPVEQLRKGDQLATADGRLVDFKLYKTVLRSVAEKNAPIRIERGGITVELSPLHMMQMRRGVWVKPAEMLSAGTPGVSRVRIGEDVVYYHMEMPDYLRDNMVVEGCVVESFGLPWVHRSGFKGSPYTWNARLNGYTRIASWTGKKAAQA